MENPAKNRGLNSLSLRKPVVTGFTPGSTLLESSIILLPSAKRISKSRHTSTLPSFRPRNMKKNISKIIKQRAPELAQAIRTYRREKQLAKPFSRHPDGFLFKGNAVMASGGFEPDETALFKRIVDGCDYLVNVGANIGYYTCLAANAGKPTVAFEPIPENARVLMENISANGWEHVEVFPLALGSEPNVLPMFGTGTGASLVEGWAGIPSSDRRFLPVNTLDNLIGCRSDFKNRHVLYWVDVEGFELNVLKGAKGLLERSSEDIWVVEICIDEHMPSGLKINPNLLETFQQFWDNGFIACEARVGLPIIQKKEIQRIVDTGQSKMTTHNFAFIKPEFRNQII